MIFLLLLAFVHGDVYMHNPRGANDRNCEKNVNRNNGNLLYDTQNNAKGGYACPRAIAGSNAAFPAKGVSPRMEFEEGSKLEIEWTAQHGCGNPQQGAPDGLNVLTQDTNGRSNNQNVDCQMVLDLACRSTLDPAGSYGTFFNADTTAYGAAGYLAVPREGLPNNDNDAATNRIGTNDPGQAAGTGAAGNNLRFGVHETPEWYNSCNRVERNRGLFTADQNVNRRSAIGTRQNPNGGRRGLECPEERDYFPYWRPSPFVAQAYLVDDDKRCGATQTLPCGGVGGTQCSGGEAALTGDWVGRVQGFMAAPNVAVDQNSAIWAGACVMKASNRVPKSTNELGGNNALRTAYNRREWPGTQQTCEALVTASGGVATSLVQWTGQMFHADFVPVGTNGVTGTAQTLAAGAAAEAAMTDVAARSLKIQALAAAGPVCNVIDYSRSNHLGNSGEDDTASRFQYTIPEVNPTQAAKRSVPTMGEPCLLRLRYNMSSSDYARNATSALNQKNGQDSPIQQDPLVKVGATTRDYLQLALNTNQVARTFQDRSYIFYIKPKAPGAAAAIVHNVNVRGKRGNIVQTYPAVEYDFIPNKLVVPPGDVLDFQWAGSDYNPRRGCNDGEGGPYVGDRNVANGLNANTQGSNQNSRADRMNAIIIADDQKNYPEAYGGLTIDTTAGAAARAKTLAFGAAPDWLATYNAATNQNLQCLTETEINNINNENRRENHPRNCAEANALVPNMPSTRITASNLGSYKLLSTRNNNFSNRDSKAQIIVSNTPTTSLTPNGLPQESVSTLDSTPFKEGGITFDSEAEQDLIAEADIPGFDPVENDDYGEGAKEGCTQDMLTFSGASRPVAIFTSVCFIFVSMLF